MFKKQTTVADLKSIIAEKLGLPVSVFHLSYNILVLNKNEDESESNRDKKVNTNQSVEFSLRNDLYEKVEMFDKNILDYYEVEIGSTVRLDLWDGWNELILAAILGNNFSCLFFK